MEGVVSGRFTLLAALGAMAGACAAPRCGIELCDVRASACQQALAQVTACLREGAPPQVPVRVVSEAAYQAEQAAAAPPADPARFGRLVGGLGLFDLAASTLIEGDLRAEVVWIRHDPARREIVVVDRGEPLDSHWQVTLLVHEYVHALQAGRSDPRVRRLADEHLGHRAVLEGEAQLVQDLAELALYGKDPGDVEWAAIFARWQRASLVTLLQSPLFLYAVDRNFVHPFGTPLVHQAWSQGGWAAVDALLASPPASSRQALSPPGAPEPSGGPWTEPISAEAIPALPPSFELLAADALGAWVLEVFLDRLELQHSRRAFRQSIYDPAANRALAAHLRGDLFAVHDDPATISTVASWRLRFDAPEAAQRVLDLVQPRLLAPMRFWRQDRDLVMVASSRETMADTFGPGSPFTGAPSGAPTIPGLRW
jgi:hypothetical protein